MNVRALLNSRLMAIVAVAMIAAILPQFFPSAYYYRVAALVFVFALAAIGLNLLMGFAGQVSLGHAGFIGIGAYAVAVGPTHLGLPPWLSFVAGAAFSAIVAFLVGRPILRLKGHYLAVATLGFGILLSIVFTNEANLTGGPDGMSVPRLVLFGWAARGSRDLVLDQRGQLRDRRRTRAQLDRQSSRARASGDSRQRGGRARARHRCGDE